MHTRPEDIVANDKNYNLFVRLPTARTLTLRHLTKQVSVAEIRDRLEIQAGLPCQLYSISLAGGQVLEEADTITFGRDLRNGAILKTALHSHIEQLFGAIKDNVVDADVLYGLITGKDGIKEQDTAGSSSVKGSDGGESDDSAGLLLEDFSNAERCFIMLYLAAHFGHHHIVRLLLKFDPEGTHRTTYFGRTALHAAAANDQLKIVQVLLHQGAALSPQDAFGKTPLDYARDSHACTCERVLKYKSQTLGRDIGEDEEEEEGRYGRGRKKVPTKKKEMKEKARVHIRVKSGAKDKTSQETQRLEVSATAGGPTAYSVAQPDGGNQKLHWESSNSITFKKTVSNDKTKTVNSGAPGGVGAHHQELLKAISVPEGSHSECSKQPAFVAVRRVPLEEQRLVTMEFTPMERAKSTSKGLVVARPRSSHKGADKHVWAEKVVRSKVDGQSEAGMKGRTQSAQYYKTKYHLQDEMTGYRERWTLT